MIDADKDIVVPEKAPVTIVETYVNDDDTKGLGAIIPTAKGRKIAYAVYAAVALAIGNTVVAYAAIEVSQPAWLIVASAVIANLAAPFSALAIANAKS